MKKKYRFYAHLGCRCSEIMEEVELEFSDISTNKDIEKEVEDEYFDWLMKNIHWDYNEIEQ